MAADGEWVLGIDFGTSYTVAAARRRRRDADVLEIGGERRIPSVVLADEDGSVVVGRSADQLATAHPSRAIRAPKSRLGEPAPVVLGGRPHHVTDLIATLLTYIYREAVRQQGSDPIEVRLTHPAAWSRPRLEQFLTAAVKAGLPNPVLVPEPVAAAVSYADETGVRDGGFVAVYDLGGGTFDTAVLQAHSEGFVVVGRPAGEDRLGGDLFDELLVNHVGSRLDPATWEALQVSDETAWQQAAAALRAEARRVKEALSTHPYAELLLPMPTGMVSQRITQAELEGLVAPYLTNSVDLLAQAVEDAGLELSDLGAVYLAGGASRTPMVERLVADAFPGVPVSRRGDPKTAVALGATHERATGSQMQQVSRIDSMPGQPVPGQAPVDTASGRTAPAAPLPAAPLPAAPLPAAPLPATPQPTGPATTGTPAVPPPQQPVPAAPAAAPISAAQPAAPQPFTAPAAAAGPPPATAYTPPAVAYGPRAPAGASGPGVGATPGWPGAPAAPKRSSKAPFAVAGVVVALLLGGGVLTAVALGGGNPGSAVTGTTGNLFSDIENEGGSDTTRARRPTTTTTTTATTETTATTTTETTAAVAPGGPTKAQLDGALLTLTDVGAAYVQSAYPSTDEPFCGYPLTARYILRTNTAFANVGGGIIVQNDIQSYPNETVAADEVVISRDQIAGCPSTAAVIEGESYVIGSTLVPNAIVYCDETVVVLQVALSSTGGPQIAALTGGVRCGRNLVSVSYGVLGRDMNEADFTAFYALLQAAGTKLSAVPR